MILLGKDIKDIVNALVKKYYTRNPFEIADHLGIMVRYDDLGELKGFYTYKRRKRIIFINRSLENTDTYKMRDMVAAHELGHAILTPKSQCYFFSDNTFFLKSKPEIEANAFAAELLISDEDILEHQSYTTEQLARVTGYEKRLVELRIKNYDIHSKGELI